MGQRVELTKADHAEIARLEAKQKKQLRPVAGNCSGCGKVIPEGFVPSVARWKSVPYSQADPGFRRLVPGEMYCKDCQKATTPAGKGHRRVLGAKAGQETAPVMAVTPPPAALEAREIASKLYRVIEAVPHSSRKLAQLAGLEYTDLILPILRKLRDAGKIEFEGGLWLRA